MRAASEKAAAVAQAAAAEKAAAEEAAAEEATGDAEARWQKRIATIRAEICASQGLDCPHVVEGSKQLQGKSDALLKAVAAEKAAAEETAAEIAAAELKRSLQKKNCSQRS